MFFNNGFRVLVVNIGDMVKLCVNKDGGRDVVCKLFNDFELKMVVFVCILWFYIDIVMFDMDDRIS